MLRTIPNKQTKEFCLYFSGNKYWFLNGKQHRVNGPAIEYSDGHKEWLLNGELYNEKLYWEALKRHKRKTVNK